MLNPLAVSPYPSLFPWAPFPVVFAAAVFVLQEVVAQSAQLAAPLAWELASEWGGPQAVPRAEQGDQQAAQSVPCELPAARLIALPDDPQAVHLEPAYSSAVH